MGQTLPKTRGKSKARNIVGHKWDMSKALQLRLSKGLTYAEIGAILGVSKVTVYNGLKDLVGLLDRPDLVKAFQSNEVEIIDSVRMLAVQAIGEQLADPARRKKVDLLRLNNLYGTFFDKRQLLTGRATSIINQLSMIIEKAHSPRVVTDTPIKDEET